MRYDDDDDTTPSLQWLEDAVNMLLAGAAQLVVDIFRLAAAITKAVFRWYWR